ncbi:AarF/UbiB family protein [Hoeflea sp.]|uniref:ABC1 kinase family protein n=1 Tax=Hoeflea sp. TaxID=1940281 RepID=UPI00198D0B91|nr:AarF/UbiB family protein [Hoeflea sp.]MBC7285007.1 phosphotransferase [Hoeflea sp.]
MAAPAEKPIGTIARAAEIGQILVRHGAKNLAGALGLGPYPDAAIDPRELRPAAAVALLRDIGPVGIKLGQLLATRGDLFSEHWIAAFATLHDQVSPVAFTQIEPVLASSWGEDWRNDFARFDEQPLASASIAQTYSAALRDGTEVIVKVRRPGTAARMEADVRLLLRLAAIAEARSPEIARYRPAEFLRTFGRNLAWEMDLAAEARACERIGGYLQTIGVKTPAIHWELTGLRVNVQERLYGTPASSLAARAGEPRVAGFARRYANAVLRMIILNGEFHGDPHPGNVFLIGEQDVGFIDFGSVGTLTKARREEIVSLVLAIGAEETGEVADILLGWAGNPKVDRDALATDLDQLIGEFRGTVLSGIEFSAIFSRVFDLLREYQLVLPPDLAILLRTLLTAEGFVRALAPDYNIAAETRPIMMELFAERFSVRGARSGLKTFRRQLLALSALLPDMLTHARAIAKSGHLPVQLDPASVERLAATRHQGQSIKGPVAAGFIVSAALLADQSWWLAGASLALAALVVLRKW